MISAVPRLRMFAGPNGSGKSTIKQELRPEWLGVYINPDEIEKGMKAQGGIDLAAFGLDKTASTHLPAFLSRSTLLKSTGRSDIAGRMRLDGSQAEFRREDIDAYLASVVSDFIRHELLAGGVSFTFETVMSSVDKIEFLRKAQDQGYRTYLYFVATDDPEINLARVRQRVLEGGHDVPPDKVVERYYRSIELLDDAVAASNRAYIFDNSGAQHRWIAEVTDGEELAIHTDRLPAWFTETSLWRSFTSDPQAGLEPATC